MAKRAVKLFGTDVPGAKGRILAAGPLTALLSNGGLRYIRWHGVEVLRAIAYLLRDRNWGTYAPAIEGLKVREDKGGFSVRYSAVCKDSEQAIRYDAAIDAKSGGTLTFSATATPLGDFVTNRTGFIVLHPLVGVVGRPLEAVHTGGERRKSGFPASICPGQPFFELRSVKHTAMPGVTATVLMEGDKFEMEDHRNWMDASYKTYVRSLLDPWPYTLKKGEAFTQSVALTIEGKGKAAKTRRAAKGVTVELGRAQGAMPAVGTGVPMAEARAALDAGDLIAAAGIKHLVAQIDGRRNRQAEAAAAFRDLKSRAGARLSLEIVLPAKQPAEAEIRAIADAVKRGGLAPDAVIVTQIHDLKSFQPSSPRPWGPTYEEMAAAARSAFPGIAVGGGMLSYFTELNRKPPPKGAFDFITHSVCPIVHAADDISVMETLEAIPSIAASARAMTGRTPYHIGPSAIACRDNPYGASVAPNPGNSRVCLSDMDPRQRGLFGAAWTLGLIARFAEGGAAAIAAGAATGPSGLIYRRASHPQPGFDDAKDAMVFPVYHVVAGLARAGGAKRLAAVSSAPSAVVAIAHTAQPGPVLWLANLTGETQSVRVSGPMASVTLAMLDEAAFVAATKSSDFLARGTTAFKTAKPLELRPYAVARLAAS